MSKFVISGFSDEICCDFEDQLITVRELGMDHISIRGVGKKSICDLSLPEVGNYVKLMLDKYSVGVSSIGSPIGKISILEMRDPEKFRAHLELAEHAAQIANLLGSEYIRFFSFYIPEDVSPTECREEVLDSVRSVLEVFGRYGVTGLHENERNIYGDSLARCLDIYENIRLPNLRAIFDFANFVHCGEDPVECYKSLRPYISYFHVKDAKVNSSDNVVCGTGDGKIAEILRMASDDGFEGFLTLEPHLVPFHLLKSLELLPPEEVATNGGRFDGKAGFTLQHNALVEILLKLSYKN